MSDVLSQDELDALLGAMSGEPTDAPAPLGPVGRVPLRVRAEVGRARVTLGALLKVRPGVVLRLDRPVGSRTTLTVEGRAVAQGEVVVVGEHYGLRVTRALR
jgi:flagellar motor switch protein FliN/FliY